MCCASNTVVLMMTIMTTIKCVDDNCQSIFVTFANWF